MYFIKKIHVKYNGCLVAWLPSCHVKQLGNRIAIDWRLIQSDKK